jgi:carbonic anhydrase
MTLARRSLFAMGGLATTGLLTGPGALAERAPDDDPWARLMAGNARFVAGQQLHPHEQLTWRETLLAGQHPFACVLACADSRVTPELVFDHGLGDLFTVRAVGEVLDDAVVGSIEYAVEHLHVPLVVVVGHARCGAVQAAVDLVAGRGPITGSVNTIARAIEATVRATPAVSDNAAFLEACVRNQAERVATELAERSTIIGSAQVDIVSAVYDLRSGRVERIS